MFWIILFYSHQRYAMDGRPTGDHRVICSIRNPKILGGARKTGPPYRRPKWA